ncbi:MAG: thiamine phosphate synthase [Alphaproteobacteria bacterium]
MALPRPPLLFISDRRIEIAESALAGGCRWISLREKQLAPADRLALLRQLLELAEPFGAVITVHADVEAARRAGAAGVHLPAGNEAGAARRALGPDALIGLSTHDEDEISRAARDGADYVTFSPIFTSPGKPGYGPALGIEALREAARSGLPILALGGVTAETAPDCLEAGARGVAVMGAIAAAADPAAAAAGLIAAL